MPLTSVAPTPIGHKTSCSTAAAEEEAHARLAFAETGRLVAAREASAHERDSDDALPTLERRSVRVVTTRPRMSDGLAPMTRRRAPRAGRYGTYCEPQKVLFVVLHEWWRMQERRTPSRPNNETLCP